MFTKQQFTPGQSWLIKRMHALKFKSDIYGVCHGFAYAAAQATIVKDVQTFLRRCRLINQIPVENFESVIQGVFNKILKSQKEAFTEVTHQFNSQYHLQLEAEKDINTLPQSEKNEFNKELAKRYQAIFDNLTLEEKDIVSIPSFFNVIELYHHGFRYPHLLPQPIPMKQDATQFLTLLSPKSLDEVKGMATLPNFTCILSLEECFMLFSSMEDIIKASPVDLAFVLSNDAHSITINFDRSINRFCAINPSLMPNLEADAFDTSFFIFKSFTKNQNCAFNTAVCYDPRDKQFAEEFLKTLLIENKDKFDVTQKKHVYDSKGVGWLYIASQHNDIETVKKLLEQKYNIDEAHVDGTTPFFMAVHNNNLEVMKLLLNDTQQHPDVNIRRAFDGATPLFLACQFGFYEAVELLMQNHVDANNPCDDGTVPLHIAVECEDVQLVKKLLDYGADPNRVDATNQTPLAMAVFQGNVQIVKLLLASGADCNCVCTFDKRDLPSEIPQMNRGTTVTTEEGMTASKEEGMTTSQEDKQNSEPTTDTIDLTLLELAERLNKPAIINELLKYSGLQKRYQWNIKQ